MLRWLTFNYTQIQYDIPPHLSTPFRLLSGGVFAPVRTFLQGHIAANELFLAMDDIRHRSLPQIINITLSATSDSGETATSATSLEIVREQGRPRTPSLSLTIPAEPMLIGNSSSLPLTSDVLSVDVRPNSASSGADHESKFVVVQQPTRGLLTLSSGVRPKSLSSAVAGQPTTRFKLGDLSGRLHYNYLGRAGSSTVGENEDGGEDSFMVEALLPPGGYLTFNRIGPLKLRFRPVQIDQAYTTSYC